MKKYPAAMMMTSTAKIARIIVMGSPSAGASPAGGVVGSVGVAGVSVSVGVVVVAGSVKSAKGDEQGVRHGRQGWYENHSVGMESTRSKRPQFPIRAGHRRFLCPPTSRRLMARFARETVLLPRYPDSTRGVRKMPGQNSYWDESGEKKV